jgi:DNA-binding PadR family transcriptional regulator
MFACADRGGAIAWPIKPAPMTTTTPFMRSPCASNTRNVYETRNAQRLRPRDTPRNLEAPGTLYPALMRMEKNRWLARSAEAPHPRARQTFRITPEGRRLLAALRREVIELYAEVVLGNEPHQGRGTKRPRTVNAPKRTIRRTR